MIQVAVGEHDGINGRWRYGKWIPVASLELTFLVKSTVDQDTSPMGGKQVARASYRARSAEERQRHGHGQVITRDWRFGTLSHGRMLYNETLEDTATATWNISADRRRWRLR